MWFAQRRRTRSQALANVEALEVRSYLSAGGLEITGLNAAAGAAGASPLTSLTGTVTYDDVSHPVEIHLLDDSAGTLDPNQPLWLLIHGRNSSPETSGLPAIAAGILSQLPTAQIAVLDWSEAAYSGDFGGTGENYIVPVAEWSAQALTDAGFAANQLNLVGHSWGADVADELAERLGQVQSIIALDAARDYPGGSYNPDAEGEIDFAAHSLFSWSFYDAGGDIFGSDVAPRTANLSIAVRRSDHSALVNAVADWLSQDSQTGLGAYLKLERLISAIPEPHWQPNSFNADGKLSADDAIFDAVIKTRHHGTRVKSLKYFNGRRKSHR